MTELSHKNIKSSLSVGNNLLSVKLLKPTLQILMFPQRTVWKMWQHEFSKPLIQIPSAPGLTTVGIRERSSEYPGISGEGSASGTTDWLPHTSSSFPPQSPYPSHIGAITCLASKENWHSPAFPPVVANDVETEALRAFGRVFKGAHLARRQPFSLPLPSPPAYNREWWPSLQPGE